MDRVGRKYKRGRAGALAAILAAALLARSAGAAELTPWRYGVLDAKSDAGFSFMIDQGFAEKKGLKLEIVQFQADTQLLQALIAGDVDSFEGGPGNDIMAAARGADVKIIGCTWPGMPHVILTRGLGSVEDLKGKSVALGPPGAAPDLMLRILLDQNHIPAADVHFTGLGNDVDRYKALVSGVVDAALVSNEFTPVIEQQGIKVLVAARDFAPDFMRLCIQATGKTIAARPGDLAHFMAAEIASLRYAVTHRDETLALTRKMAKINEDDPRPGFIYDWAVKTGSVDPEVSLPVAKLAYMEEQLVKTGNIPKPYDVAGMADPGPRDKALAILGK